MKRIKGIDVESIEIDDSGNVFIVPKFDDELEINEIFHEVEEETDEVGECETADDCVKKYGDPPIGYWVCQGGRCKIAF